MKNKISSILLAVLLCTSVQAQDNSTDKNINPLNVARAFALKPPASFECRLNADSLVGKTLQKVTIEFVVRKSDFGITNMVINGKQILLPEPIYGIPMGDGGLFQNVYVDVTAKTATGEYAGNGNVYLPNVLRGDHIEAILRPNDVAFTVPLPPGVDPRDIDLQILNFYYGYGWGPDGNGNLIVSMPPIGGSYDYILRRRSDGVPVGQGKLTPFQDPTIANNTSFGVTMIGNVLGVDFPDNRQDWWLSFGHLKFNCDIPMQGGGTASGKVIYTDVDAGGLEIVVDGSVSIVVFRATEHGEMVPLALEDHSIVSPWGTKTRVNTVLRNAGKVVVTIQPMKDSLEAAWVSFHRYYGLPSSGGTNGALVTEI